MGRWGRSTRSEGAEPHQLNPPAKEGERGVWGGGLQPIPASSLGKQRGHPARFSRGGAAERLAAPLSLRLASPWGGARQDATPSSGSLRPSPLAVPCPPARPLLGRKKERNGIARQKGVGVGGAAHALVGSPPSCKSRGEGRLAETMISYFPPPFFFFFIHGDFNKKFVGASEEWLDNCIWGSAVISFRF